jgi:hypothetical protein
LLDSEEEESTSECTRVWKTLLEKYGIEELVRKAASHHDKKRGDGLTHFPSLCNAAQLFFAILENQHQPSPTAVEKKPRAASGGETHSEPRGHKVLLLPIS